MVQTACSQRWNIYFVAHGQEIKVFVPEYNSHQLGRDEAFKFTAATANADAQGFMSSEQPHHINHIIVGDLGSEEILLIAMDSGNVAAYYTSRIQQAVCRAEVGEQDLEAVCQPFFTRWVGQSAWGLAIHKEARMIAVSANRGDVPGSDASASVTMFSFALINKSGSDGSISDCDSATAVDENAEWACWTSNYGRDIPDRTRNWKRTVHCHFYNIPNISFVNSDEDRQGRYLLTTAIDGEFGLWEIWTSTQIIERNFSESPEDWRSEWMMATRHEFE